MAVVVESEQILVEHKDSVLEIRMNRPEKKNALTHAMYTALVSALAQADVDPSVRVIYITGNGGAFTSGNDVLDFMMAPPNMEDSPVALFLKSLPTIRKPLVAAVNGLAIGIGTTLMLHCDLAYAAESAEFQMPFVNLGLCPEAGSSLLLPRLMGHTRAAELLLLGERFGAAKALQYGLITAVVADAELASVAMGAARRLAAQPPAAVRLTKSLLKRADAAAVEAAMRIEGQEFQQRLRSPEAAEAFAAFAERRKPDFSKFV
jgi:enoyl-CoA hydratase/carnithine racemase